MHQEGRHSSVSGRRTSSTFLHSHLAMIPAGSRSGAVLLSGASSLGSTPALQVSLLEESPQVFIPSCCNVQGRRLRPVSNKADKDIALCLSLQSGICRPCYVHQFLRIGFLLSSHMFALCNVWKCSVQVAGAAGGGDGCRCNKACSRERYQLPDVPGGHAGAGAETLASPSLPQQSHLQS